jgi:hypothetical protein
MRKPTVRMVKLISINLLVLVVLLESTSVAVYFFKTGEFFYTRNRARTSLTRAQFETNGTHGGSNPMLAYQLHPYFGFVSAHGYSERAYPGSPFTLSLRANNFGFLCPYEFPFKKTNQNQFVIGIFGGSVATFYSFYELENHVLMKALQRLPRFRNKEIIVLNFAAGSYKQPQQLLVLNYFLSIGQELDLAINIDGFNDVLFSYLNNKFGVEMSMPNSHVAMPLIDLANKELPPDELTLALEILELKTQLRDGLAKLENCRMATCYSLRWLWLQYLFNQYQKKTMAFNELKRNGSGSDSLIHVNRVEKPLADPEAYEQLAGLWANSSLAMKQLLSARGIPYFHFIQPNQYYPTKRHFIDEEKKIAFGEGNAGKEVVPLGYASLLARLSSLQQAGVKVFNEANVFDDANDMVYIDNCCHYTQNGNSIFAAHLAQTITTQLNDATAP